MKSPKKIILILSIIIALIIIGFYRDFVFKNINAVLQAYDADADYQLPPSLGFLSGYKYSTLVNLKWVLTLLFSGVYLLVTLFTVKIIFNDKKYLQITFISFISLTVVSLLLIITGYLWKDSAEKMYEFARYVMGMIQSPLLLMILIPAFKLSEKENS